MLSKFLKMSKFRKLFAADPFVATKYLADKVAELQAQAEKEHAEAVLQAQEAYYESTLMHAVSESYRDEASRLKTLAEKLGELTDPAA